MRTILIIQAVLLHIRIEMSARRSERRPFAFGDGMNMRRVFADRQPVQLQMNQNPAPLGLLIVAVPTGFPMESFNSTFTGAATLRLATAKNATIAVC